MLTTSVRLLERLQRSPEPAVWQRFVDLYGPVLLSWARRCGAPQQDAADLVQEVFAVLLVKLPQFEHRSPGGFRAWLRVVVRCTRRLHYGFQVTSGSPVAASD